MGRRNEIRIEFAGDGNNIASTNPSENTVTINGRTYEMPEGGTLTVDGNQVSIGNRRSS